MQGKQLMSDAVYYSSWSAMTVGVADLDVALKLWIDECGMTVVKSRVGADEGIANEWGIQADDIQRQVLLSTGDYTTGMLHLVEFAEPDEPVRKNANPYDLTPKSLDVYTNDLVQKLGHLSSIGYTFRSQEAHLIHAPDGTAFREAHMFAHDEINVVLLELVGKKKPFTGQGMAAVGPLVMIVPDVAVESDFFQSVFMLDTLNVNILSEPDLIKAIGLPDGTALNIHILGRSGFDLGQLELIEYAGLEGNNLYPRAKPKALGLLHVSYVIPDNELLLQRLDKLDLEISRYDNVDSIHGHCDIVSFYSPAGLKVEVYTPV